MKQGSGSLVRGPQSGVGSGACTLGDVLIGAAALFTALIAGREGSLERWRWGRVAVLAALVELAGFEFGLTPLAQWLIVPPLALYLARKMEQWRSKTASSQAHSSPMR